MADRDAQFHAFVTEHSGALLRLAYLLTTDHARAEDAVQEALLKMYPRWRRIDDPERYARRVLTRVAADQGRRAFRRRERSTDTVPDVADSHDGLDGVDDRPRLRAALAALPPGQRAAVVCRHWLDLDAEAAADLLGCSPATVRSQAMRGLAKLREMLAEPTPCGRTDA